MKSRKSLGFLFLGVFAFGSSEAMAQNNVPLYGGGMYSPNQARNFNPYLPSTGIGVGTNPYLPNPFPPDPYPYPYNPYYPGYMPYYYDPGSVLRGTADVMRAYGTVINQQEQARVIREQALQARIDTERKKFDHNMYIKMMTPTWGQEQTRLQNLSLKRIQATANPADIVSGTAVNVLLDDIRKYPNKRINLDPIPLSEDILGNLNVIKAAGNLGVLRDQGRFTWPLALQEVLTLDEQKKIELTAQAAVKKAMKGHLDANLLKDLNLEIDNAWNKLVRKVNDIPTGQYIEARRFLNDFKSAQVALERGEATTQANYQRFIAGGKTVQELMDYMVQNGLKFAPATSNDEAAYRALHSAMVNFDVALNTQLGSAEPASNLPVPSPNP